MNMIKSVLLTKLSHPRWQFFILLTFTLFIHSPLLVVKQIENPDAGYILPMLSTLSFPIGYFKALLNLNTMDFQPVRDLTLYLDIWIYNLTGFTLGVVFNCFIWAGICLQLIRIVAIETNKTPGWRLLYLVICFSVYPIFYNSVNWGIARKHLLALFFILTATRNLYDFRNKEKRIISVILPYTLSLLSLPIAVGWPLWVMLRLGISNILSKKDLRSFMIIIMIIMLLIVGINWFYYKTNIHFLDIYPQKASGFDFRLTLVNLGFQFKQMAYPYELAFVYNYHGYILGFATLLPILAIACFYFRKKEKFWSWLLFAMLPLFVTLSTPYVYYDPYVLITLSGLFLFLVTHLYDFLTKFALCFTPFLIFWSLLTWQGNSIWGDELKFFQASFATNPNCSNAIMYGSRIYRSRRKMPNNLYDFIQVYECFKDEPLESRAMKNKKLDFEALMLFSEDEIDEEYRRKRLGELRTQTFYSMILYAAFLSKMGDKEEIESIMGDLNLLSDAQLKIGYDPLVLSVLPGYCEQNEMMECVRFMSKWSRKNISVSYF